MEYRISSSTRSLPEAKLNLCRRNTILGFKLSQTCNIQSNIGNKENVTVKKNFFNQEGMETDEQESKILLK